MANQAADWIGSIIGDGRYEIQARLGEGGMGAVYRAKDTRLGADVVVKIPHRSMLDDAEFVERFTREIRALVKLAHPHVVPVIDVGKFDGVPFAVMQYLSGGNLDDRRPRDSSGRKSPRSPEDVCLWLPTIAKALDFIHAKGFVHRDIKPTNIFFDSSGNAYLGDFGVIKVLAQGERKSRQTGALTAAGMVLGTPEYMAPELVMGDPFDGRVDQYALAATVYELVCGRCPFEAITPTAILVAHTSQEPPDPRELCPALPKPSAATLLTALAKQPDDRFKSCERFADAFTLPLRETNKRRVTVKLEEQKTESKPQVGPERKKTGSRKKRDSRKVAKPTWPIAPIAGGGLAVAMIAAVVFFALRTPTSRTPNEPVTTKVTEEIAADDPPATASNWRDLLAKWDEDARIFLENASAARAKIDSLEILDARRFDGTRPIVDNFDQAVKLFAARSQGEAKSLEDRLRTLEDLLRKWMQPGEYRHQPGELKTALLKRKPQASAIRTHAQELQKGTQIDRTKRELHDLEQYVDGMGSPTPSPSILATAEKMRKCRQPSVANMGQLALVRATGERNLKTLESLTNVETPKERVRVANVLLVSGVPESAQALANWISRDREVVSLLPPEEFKKSLASIPEAWRRSLPLLAESKDKSVSLAALKAMARSKTSFDKDKIAQILSNGQDNPSIADALAAMIVARWSPCVDALPNILKNNSSLRIDAISPVEAEEATKANPVARMALAKHLVATGTSQQSIWGVDALMRIATVDSSTELKVLLAKPIRSGREPIAAKLLTSSDKASLDLAAWLLDPKNNLGVSAAAIDPAKLAPQVMAHEGLRRMAIEKALSGDPGQKQWAVREIIGQDSAATIYNARKLRGEMETLCEKANDAWSKSQLTRTPNGWELFINNRAARGAAALFGKLSDKQISAWSSVSHALTESANAARGKLDKFPTTRVLSVALSAYAANFEQLVSLTGEFDKEMKSMVKALDEKERVLSVDEATLERVSALIKKYVSLRATLKESDQAIHPFLHLQQPIRSKS